MLQKQLRKNEKTENRLEYFVHYENCNNFFLFSLCFIQNKYKYFFLDDKRLDEWINIERFDLVFIKIKKTVNHFLKKLNISDRK